MEKENTYINYKIPQKSQYNCCVDDLNIQYTPMLIISI